jgi:tRNA 2-thiouridine synthesizing protein A
MMTMHFDQELDARGLKCPLPILRCKKGIATLAPLQVLKIVATDAGAVKDFQAFCKQTGHEMLAFEEVDSVSPKEYLFFIRKRAA